MLAAVPPQFDPTTAPEHPVPLFVEWLCHAIDSGAIEPHAMTLSTADTSGRPSARVLILKDVTPEDAVWHFASSAASGKGVQLEANPVAALTFYWPTVGRQVRIEGTVSPDPPAVSAADFLARSPGARALAGIGRQSRPLSDPAEIAAAVTATIESRANTTVPAHWRSYAVRADTVEFWQADPERRHQRLRYTRAADWSRTLLWP